jgi:hypothetical protein
MAIENGIWRLQAVVAGGKSGLALARLGPWVHADVGSVPMYAN